MYRLPTILFTLLLATSGPMAHAQSMVAPQGMGGTSFTCLPEHGNRGGQTLCTCYGLSDCLSMVKSGVCKADNKVDDTECDDSVDSCICTMGGARILPGHELRPKAEAAPATRNAPKVRDHRTRDRVPAAGEARKPVPRDHRDETAPRAD